MNLCLNRCDLRSRNGRFCFGFLEGLLADGVDAEQIAISFEVLLRQSQLSFLLIELSSQAAQPGFVGFDLRLIHPRIELGKQLALLHRIADIDMKFFNLAGHLRADVNVLLRFQFALRRDHFLNRSTGNCDRLLSVLLRLACRAGIPVPAAGDQPGEGK